MKFFHYALTLLLPATALAAAPPTAALPTIAAGSNSSFAIDSEGRVFGWGYGGGGELGNRAVNITETPILIMERIKAVSAGTSHTLFLDTGGNVHATGHGGDGQLGIGKIILDGAPYIYTPKKAFSDVKAISAGGDTSLFLKTDGTAWACGSGGGGQLGLPRSPDAQLAPAKVMAGVQAISAGGHHSLFLKTDGSVWATGDNSSGQLGDGTLRNRKTPVHVMDGVQAIAAGGNHSLFLKTNGSVWAAGANNSWQLDSTAGHPLTTPIRLMTGVKAIAAGSETSFFIKSDGGLWVAGLNYYGVLGYDPDLAWQPPVRVLMGVAEITVGTYHSIARKTDGTVWSTGANNLGQLGDGTSTDHFKFARVAAFARSAGPEIVISQPTGTPLEDGISKKSFGTSRVGKKAGALTFLIKNIGTKPLTGLTLRTHGAAAGDFTYTKPAATTLKTGETTTFQVTFKPTAAGTRTGVINVKSNDNDESPFDIKLTGLGTTK